jgi:hypothetical protein
MFLMYLSKPIEGYRDGPRINISTLQELVFKTKEDAQHYFNNLNPIKNKIGYWREMSFSLVPIEDKIYER